MANKSIRERDPLIPILEAIRKLAENKLKDETLDELSTEQPRSEANKYLDLITNIEFLLHHGDVNENNFELVMQSLNAVSERWIVNKRYESPELEANKVVYVLNRLILHAPENIISYLDIIEKLSTMVKQSDNYISQLDVNEICIRSVLSVSSKLICKKEIKTQVKKKLLAELENWINSDRIQIEDAKAKNMLIEHYIGILRGINSIKKSLHSNIPNENIKKAITSAIRRIKSSPISKYVDIIDEASGYINFLIEENQNDVLKNELKPIIHNLTDCSPFNLSSQIAKAIDDLMPTYFCYQNIHNTRFQEIIQNIESHYDNHFLK